MMGSRRETADGLGAPPSGISRRTFLGWVIAAPTLVAAARFGIHEANAAVPREPGVSDAYDLSDMLTDAAAPTSHLITITMNADGTADFALPRAEVGQGITTAIAMTIADELDMPVENVRVTLADARPELNWNQITGGSNTMHSIYTPVRVAGAIARGQLLEAASFELGGAASRLTASNGVVRAPNGRSVTYGQLATRARATKTSQVTVTLKSTA